MINVLTSEYVVGLVVGLALSLVGAWYQAYSTDKKQKKTALELVRDFCIDIIQSLQVNIKEMDDTRDRAKAIHHDYLNMVDAQVAVFYRNSEHLVRLPTELRNDVRKYINTISFKKAAIATHLGNFYKIDEYANQVQANGNGPEAQRIRETGNIALQEAQKAADKLALYAPTGDSLIKKLQDYKP